MTKNDILNLEAKANYFVDVFKKINKNTCKNNLSKKKLFKKLKKDFKSLEPRLKIEILNEQIFDESDFILGASYCDEIKIYLNKRAIFNFFGNSIEDNKRVYFNLYDTILHELIHYHQEKLSGGLSFVIDKIFDYYKDRYEILAYAKNCADEIDRYCKLNKVSHEAVLKNLKPFAHDYENFEALNNYLQQDLKIFKRFFKNVFKFLKFKT